MIVAIAASPLVGRAAYARKRAGARGKIVVDPSRELVRKHGFQTMYEVPGDLQTQLRLELLDLHAAALKEGGDLVLDHCAVEWMADWMRWHWAAGSTRAWDAAMAKAAKLVAKYDVVAHLTSGPARSYDGYVWLDKANAAQVEELMFFLYGKFGAKVEKVRG